jgi:hypothetical protein
MRVQTGDGEGLGGRVRRGFWVTVILLAIFAAAGWFVVRTAGARDLIRDWIAKRVGVEIEVKATRLVWPYDLQVEGIRSAQFEDGATPGLAIGRLRLGWRPSGRFLRLDECRVRLRNERDGSWAPAALAKLGDCLGAGVADVSAMTASFRETMRVAVRADEIVWLTANGQECVAAQGVRFAVTPVQLPGRRVFHYTLDVHRIRGAVAAGLSDLRWEWLASERMPYIELDSRGREPVVNGDGLLN